MSTEPRFVTHAEQEALEGRIINRIAELELRITREINTAFWRQALWLGGILIVLGIAVINVGITILGKLP